MLKNSKKKTGTFTSRLFICIFTTSFLLLLVGEIIMFSASMSASQKMDTSFVMSNLETTQSNIERALKQVDDSVQLAFAQKGVLTAAHQNWKVNTNSADTVLHAMKIAIASSDMLCHMSLCSEEYGVLATQINGILPYSNVDTCKEYYLSESSSVTVYDQQWFFLQRHPLSNSRYALTNLREITPLSGSQEELVLTVTISEAKLSSNYSFLGEDSFITTIDGTIISAVDQSRIGTIVDERTRGYLQDVGKDIAFLYRENLKSTYAVYLPTISAYLITTTSASAVASTRLLMVVIALSVITIGLVLSLLWSKYISATMTTPIQRLRLDMEKVRNGDLSIRSEIEREDELGYICESFNHMMDSLNGYIEQLNEQQNIVKENEIRLLQSQINPHLLYNTLDSALFLMYSNETTQSLQILEEMSRYFKLALQRGNKITTIGDAINHIRVYLRLQNLSRMKNFELRVSGDSTLANAKILHMLIQPIVENSVLHGFDGSFADGTIEINLKQKSDRLFISITDDGIGMDDETLNQLRSSLINAVPPSKSYGIWNIAQRIRMYYGSAYGVHVNSEFGEFTTVILEIPYDYERSEEENV